MLGMAIGFPSICKWLTLGQFENPCFLIGHESQIIMLMQVVWLLHWMLVTTLLLMLRLAIMKVLTFGSYVVQDHVQKSFIDKWGTSFEVGDYVVASLYYQKWGTNEYSYVLLKYFHLAYVHSHLVCAFKFLMSPKDYRVNGNSLVYELNDDTLIGI